MEWFQKCLGAFPHSVLEKTPLCGPKKNFSHSARKLGACKSLRVLAISRCAAAKYLGPK